MVGLTSLLDAPFVIVDWDCEYFLPLTGFIMHTAPADSKLSDISGRHSRRHQFLL